MITQVSFTTNQELKERALQKAKDEGITLKALLTYAMKSFVDGKISLDLAFTSDMPNLIELKNNEVDVDLRLIAEKARKSRKNDLVNI